MKRRMIFRIFAGYVLVSLFAVAIFAAYTLRLLNAGSFDSLARGLQIAALTARAAVAPLVLSGSVEELRSLTREMASQGSFRLTVIDEKGVVLADSQEDPSLMENHRLRPEVGRALDGDLGVSSRYSSTTQRWMVYAAVPLSSPRGIVGAVRASSYREALDAPVLRQAGLLALFSSILLGLCLLSALILSRALVMPLRDLSAVVGKFAEGDFGARLHLKRRDEIRGLAESFNAMAAKVQELFRQITERTQELDGIFSSVDQGIVMLDGSGRIVRCNKWFAELFGMGSIEGRIVWEITRAPQLLELLERARSTGEAQSEEIVIRERTMLCRAQRMADQGDKLIVVLHDTSDLRRLEDVKRDFVVNASHELRTPLTSIRGSIEMLEGEVAGEAGRWVQTIRRNADRMTAIVEDLLLLSRLEQRGPESERGPSDVARIASDVVGMFLPKAQSKGLALLLSAPDVLRPVAADPFLVEQLLVNLVDNALKYTEAGEVRVSCAAEGKEMVRIEVRDTGIGIPAEHLPRIFERFYVVDKSRSRKVGGTGLGLSIVKHIVQAAGGTLETTSEEGKGTRFLVRLPCLRPLDVI